jgi:Sec-independent protein translocase protein TatA
MFGLGLIELSIALVVLILLFPGRLVRLGRDLGETVGITRRMIDED